MSGRVRGYLGMSLDGRIAGPGDDLEWLHATRTRRVEEPVPEVGGAWLTYEAFMADIGVLLMGRGTFDVVSGFQYWPYGETPVVVATNRALPTDVPATVTAAAGSVEELIDAARERSGGGDVYLDGGRLVSAALDAGLLDELTTTVLPTVRGPGVGLFEHLGTPRDLDLVNVATDPGGAVQLTWVPQPDGGSA